MRAKPPASLFHLVGAAPEVSARVNAAFLAAGTPLYGSAPHSARVLNFVTDSKKSKSSLVSWYSAIEATIAAIGSSWAASGEEEDDGGGAAAAPRAASGRVSVRHSAGT